MIQFSLLAGITFLAYVVKGLTGFGPAIVFISLGSLCMEPVQVVAISPVLDIAAGAFLFWKDKSYRSMGFWLILGIPLVFGVVLGAIGLRLAQTGNYRMVLGTAIVVLGVWFVFRRRDRLLLKSVLPRHPNLPTMVVAAFSGISGGLFGISGPPLIWYFGSRFERESFRQIIVPLFLIESSARVIVYYYLEMITLQHIGFAGSLLPFLFIGLFVGNHWFNRLPQAKFERIIGVVLFCLGVKIAFFS